MKKFKSMKTISIKNAVYAGKFKLKILFTDKKEKIVNFETFLKKHSHPQFNKYKKEENFKKFQIENGNVVWGKDWDMIFPIWDLYKGKVQ